MVGLFIVLWLPIILWIYFLDEPTFGFLIIMHVYFVREIDNFFMFREIMILIYFTKNLLMTM